MTPADLLLPEGSLLLHVGPSKTGSTALQAALHGRRAELAEHGVCYAGSRLRPRKAGWAVLGWAPPGRARPDLSRWDAFCRTVSGLDASRICVSTEDFGRVHTGAKARQIVEGLGGSRVHVVSAVRPYRRLLPSYWQEMVRTRLDTRTYEQWLHDVLDAAPVDGRGWAPATSHNLTATVPAWLEALRDPGRYTLVVLADGDHEILPRTFEGLLGLPAHFLDSGERPNVSLSLNGTELLRRLNEVRPAHDWPARSYVRLVRQGLIRGVVATDLVPGEHRIPELPEWAVEPLATLSARRVEEVRALGVRVIGDPEALRLPPVRPATRSEFVTEMISIEAARNVLASTYDEVFSTRGRSTVRPPRPPGAEALSGRELLNELAARVRRRVFGSSR